jgi:hypothetical protein
VRYAILGEAESCTGDPARRAGNEFLAQMLMQANVEVLGTHDVKKIITICPHCYNTLKNEYGDFGGHYQVAHHSEVLAKLVAQGKLKPTGRVEAKIAYHDACYLGRHNQVYDPPRAVLANIPGVELVEAEATRDRGMCCGAGGAQFFKEEETGRRTRERSPHRAIAGHRSRYGGQRLPVLHAHAHRRPRRQGPRRRSPDGHRGSAARIGQSNVGSAVRTIGDHWDEYRRAGCCRLGNAIFVVARTAGPALPDLGD